MKRKLMRENKDDLRYADDMYFVIDDPKDLNYAGIIWDIVIDDKHFITTGEPEHGQYDEGEARDKVVYWIVENMKDEPIFDNIYSFDNLLSFYDEDEFKDMSDFGDWIYDNYEVCCDTNYFIPNEKFGVTEDVTQEVRREVRNNLEGSKFIEKLKEQFGIDEDEKVNFNESKRIRNRRMIKESDEQIASRWRKLKRILADYLDMKPKELHWNSEKAEEFNGAVFDTDNGEQWLIYDDYDGAINRARYFMRNAISSDWQSFIPQSLIEANADVEELEKEYGEDWYNYISKDELEQYVDLDDIADDMIRDNGLGSVIPTYDGEEREHKSCAIFRLI